MEHRYFLIIMITVYKMQNFIMGNYFEEQSVIRHGDYVWEVDKFEFYRTRPPSCDGNKTVVEIAIFPMGIPDMSIEKMTLTLDFYCQLEWRDCRLTDLIANSQKDKVPKAVSWRLWTPSLVILNGIQTKSIHATFVQKSSESTVISVENRLLSFIIRKDETFYCVYDLSAYPMDTQRCEIQFELDDDEENYLDLKASKMELPIIKNRSPPQFKVKSVGMRNICNLDDYSFSKGTDCVTFYVELKRELLYYLIVTYLPSALIVILSWVSFWLDVDASAPRVTLGLTSLLTLTTQFSSVQKNLPPVSYIKAIDLWMFCCMFMIFCSLLEFALVNYQYRKKMKQEAKASLHFKNKLSNSSNLNKVYVFQAMQRRSISKSPSPEINNYGKEEDEKRVPKVDKFARICFPLFFLIFNIVYWSYYLSRD